ncbi:MAG: hypothetical protein AAGF06_05650, partial [Pseudomonadota bacterium]
LSAVMLDLLTEKFSNNIYLSACHVYLLDLVCQGMESNNKQYLVLLSTIRKNELASMARLGYGV